MTVAAALLRVSRTLHGVHSLEALMERVRAAVTENSRFRHCYVHLLNRDGKTFEIVGYVLPDQALMRQQLKLIDVSQDRLIQFANSATEPFFIEDLRTHAYADQKQVEFFGNRTSICVPMYEADANIGPLIIATYADQGVLVPTAVELDFFVQLGSLVAVVIGRLRAEEARQAAESRIAQNERMQSLGKMAGEVAHDFNNLLMSILSNVELAIDEVQSTETRELLADVRDSALRASRMTRQLLAFSRGQVLKTQPLVVTKLLDEVRRLVEPLMPPTVKLVIRDASAAGSMVGDEDQLTRALMNLTVNARDAIGSKAGTVTLEAERIDITEEAIASRSDLPVGPYVVMSVSDDGAGMNEEMRQRIFEPFFSTKGERGTGLGLSVVDGVVRQHGGSTHVYSELGQGTTIKLFLPLREAPALPTPALPTRTRSGNELVLVVDDDENVGRSVERVLRRAGLDVVVCATAQQALGVLDTRRVDLLITDVMLPGVDGVELADRAKGKRAELAVRFMTGYARGRVSSLTTPHLTKPFSPGDLLRLVDEALGAAKPG